MSAREELKEKFSKLIDEEKLGFMKSVMPSSCQIFGRIAEKTMSEMMPICREMMKSCNMDMQGIMKRMGMGGSNGFEQTLREGVHHGR